MVQPMGRGSLSVSVGEGDIVSQFACWKKTFPFRWLPLVPWTKRNQFFDHVIPILMTRKTCAPVVAG